MGLKLRPMEWPDFSVSVLIMDWLAFKHFKNIFTENFNHVQNK